MSIQGVASGGGGCARDGIMGNNEKSAVEFMELTNDEKCQFAALYCPNLSTSVNSTKRTEPFIYPNPSFQHSSIKFLISEETDSATLHIFDMLGNMIKVISIDKVENGVNEVHFNTADFSPGQYICKVHTKNLVLTQVLTILK